VLGEVEMASDGWVDSSETTGPEATEAGGVIMMATLPGDRVDAGEPWRAALAQASHRLHLLGVRAAPIVAAHAADLRPDALVVYVHTRQTRMAVQALVGQLLRRDLRIPLLLGGAGVDAAFAQWVAIPQDGIPYWGGVYYCEDEREVLEVLRQIIFFEPPPPAHVHEAPGTEVGECSTCAGCPLAPSCDSQV
jgi:hypothetical protein